MLQFAIAFGIALAGGFLGEKTKIPAGAMLGATFAVIAYHSLREANLRLPDHFNLVSQAMVGMIIASAYNAKLLHMLAQLWLPIILSCLGLILTGILMSIALYKLGLLDFPTAYISTSPGAMNVLVAISGDMHADAAMVASFHFVRVFIVGLSAPLIFKLCKYLSL